MKEQKGFKTIYDLEAEDFDFENSPQKEFLIAKTAFKASIFCLVLISVAFLVRNQSNLNSQITDWRSKGAKVSFAIDNDGDGISDGWEAGNGLNPSFHKDATADDDGDGLNNLIEYQISTDPQNKDTDDDGFFDGQEFFHGFNPKGVGITDFDGDGIPDWWEKLNGLNYKDAFDAKKDFDSDGIDNQEEYSFSTDPWRADTDLDGLSDSKEIELMLNPLGEGVLNSLDKGDFYNNSDHSGNSDPRIFGR